MCTYIIQFLLAIFARIFARIRDILHVSGRLDINELALFFNFEIFFFFLNLPPIEQSQFCLGKQQKILTHSQKLTF